MTEVGPGDVPSDQDMPSGRLLTLLLCYDAQVQADSSQPWQGCIRGLGLRLLWWEAELLPPGHVTWMLCTLYRDPAAGSLTASVLYNVAGHHSPPCGPDRGLVDKRDTDTRPWMELSGSARARR